MNYKFAEIIVDINHQAVNRKFTYKIPENLDIKLGLRVKVPFGRGNKLVEGFVIGLTNSINFDEKKAKFINSIIDNIPVLDEKTIKLAKWMEEEYDSNYSSVISCIMPSGIKGRDNLIQKEKWVKLIDDIEKVDEYISENEDKTRPEKQLKILEYLKNKKKSKVKDIEEKFSISNSPIKTLIKKNLLKEFLEEKDLDPYKNEKFEDFKKIQLNEEQNKIYKEIKNNKGSLNLIHGVTASGKTEIYLQLIEELLKEDKDSIVLVPEIALTPQMVDRFKGRFKNLVAVTHSKLNSSERYNQWKKAKDGEVKIMIGPRSAIFTPFNNLGLIVIDEEHENTYKSETTPKYDAREVAEKLNELTKCTIVLGTATPSVKTYYRAKKGVYNLYKLNKRIKGFSYPEIEIIDMRKELLNGNRGIFSEKLIKNINESLLKKEQVIFFINRRGYSNFVSCRECGYVIKCENCDVSYAYHKHKDKLKCHYCSSEVKKPEKCPECGSKYIKNFGIGTEKVLREVKKVFKLADPIIMDSDAVSKKGSYKKIINKFKNGEKNVLIGTQMITKGHDFDNVSIIAIIAADMLLNFSNFKTSEYAFSQLMQVSGRAGRGKINAKSLIQTYEPDNFVLKSLEMSNYEYFYEEEIAYRKISNYPPFSSVATLILKSESEKEVIKRSFEIKNILEKNNKDKIDILGPTPAEISKIRNMYRWRIILKADKKNEIKEMLRNINNSSKVYIDVNFE